jgi:hypothetical protein
LNLVVPFISGDRAYGGPATAVRFFQRLAAEFESARIVLTHDTEAAFDFGKWTGWSVDCGDTSFRSIAFLGNRTTPLHVSPGDLFIATAWFTATYTKQIVASQIRWNPEASRRFVYLIQDYEPGAFYPWSSRYVYARSTYHDTDNIIAVFNSLQLADYFSRRHLHFSEEYAFEPMLSPRLLQKKAEIGVRQKERLILVYGRPSATRNAFDLIVAALKIWAHTFPCASDWTVISAGEPHADVPLGGPIILHSLGKLTLDDYADHLSRCWAGMSFVLSPHPGNPPLELARFGAWSITNTFECKDLAGTAPNIISVEPLTPDRVAEELIRCCEQYRPGVTTAVRNANPAPDESQEEFPFAHDLATAWKKSCRIGTETDSG